MSHQLVHDYLNKIDQLRKIARTSNEQTIRPAFRSLLDQWAARMNLIFTEEVRYDTTQKSKVYPDGTIFHSVGVPFGFWEAKDPKDKLDEEIRDKFRKGYPKDNIIFENSERAVLYQTGEWVFEASMTDPEALTKLLNLFFGFEPPAVGEFRRAVARFSQDLPHVLDALRKRIDEAYAGNAAFQSEATTFLLHIKETVNPTLGEADVREMLIQHILTEDIFTQVFNDSQFHRENNIARELYKLENSFLKGPEKRSLLAALEPYFATIRSTAAMIDSHGEKQTFLKLIYENFYKVYNPKAADRLGVVYTPNEIVKFMIEGADWLTQKHFGKALIDPHVEILDPATGTGTFICELIEYFRGQPEKLAHKYKNDLHANEVAILPYYVANLNIEATYAAVTGQFAEFPNLCFVDTLDNVAGLGIRAGYQHDMFSGMSEENVARVKRQNAKKISVIIGNPPYNANQQNENDNNKNREYKRIDELIKSSYIRRSTAQKTKVYDMYARFYRWASDRLHDDGVLAFITNRSFIDSRTFDGFRKCVADEFSDVYVVDLGGDVRANPKLSGTKNNVFGIQTGVAIAFMVKRKGARGGKIHYVRRPELDTAEDKLTWLAANPASQVKYERVEPDKNGNWINLTENLWDDLIPVASKAEKAGKRGSKDRAIFQLFSLGIVTNRDEWAYDFQKDNLHKKISFFSHHFNEEIERWRIASRPTITSDFVSRDIKWTSELEAELRRERPIKPTSSSFLRSAYRPFVEKWTYFAKPITHRPYQNFDIFPHSEASNSTIAAVVEPRAGFSVVASSLLPNKDFFMPSAAQHFARYRYTKDGEKIDNITDWALKQFRAGYAKDAPPSPLRGGIEGGGRERSEPENTPTGSVPAAPGQSPSFGPPQGGGKKIAAISKDDIFHYVYGVLHDPVYREKYAINLKREFPRIPFYPDFWTWAGWGKALMDLHIGYETVEPWPLSRLDTPDEKARAGGVAPKALLKADKDNGIIRLDSETQLSGIPPEVWTYKLGNRSGLEWILDQYKEKTPKDPTIREKFNTYRFADYKEKVVDLLMRVTRVSVETVRITEAMKAVRRTDTE